MANSVLKNLKPISSLLEAQAAMNPKGRGKKNNALAFSLNLTALIDAFAILVIFLLSNYNGDAQNLDFAAKTELPKASYSEILSMGTVVKIENGQYFLDNQKVTLATITEKLIQSQKNKKEQTEDVQKSLIIVADKNMNFNLLSPVVRAAGQAGYDSYKFAVLPSGKTAQGI